MIVRTGNAHKMLLMRGKTLDGRAVWFPPERLIDVREIARDEDVQVRYELGNGKMGEVIIAYGDFVRYIADRWIDEPWPSKDEDNIIHPHG